MLSSHPAPDTYTQRRSSELLPNNRGLSLCYQLWRGIPATPQKLTPDLAQAWSHGFELIRQQLNASVSSKSVYQWLGMQIIMAGLALLFSMMPDSFFRFYPLQWLLTTVIVLSVVDLVVSVYLNHPNRLTLPFSIRVRMFLGLIRSSFYELFLYPILMLSIFHTIRNQSYQIFEGEERNFDNTDTWGFATLSTVCIMYLMTVYIMRFRMLFTIVSILLHSRSNISGAKKFGTIFLKGLLIQGILQIAIQIMLIILISVRYEAEIGITENNDKEMERDIYDENGDVGGPDDDMEDIENTVALSKYLKVMISGGVLIPMLAFVMYFVSTQKLMEEFPISLFLDWPTEQRAISSSSRIDTAKLKVEFQTFHSYNKSFTGGFLNLIQPLFSPLQAIVCGLFTVYIISFFVCFASVSVVSKEDESETVNTANAFSVGYYSSLEGMSGSAIKATFVIVLIGTILSNTLPMVYGILGTALLPLNAILGAVWLALKLRQSRNPLSVHAV